MLTWMMQGKPVKPSDTLHFTVHFTLRTLQVLPDTYSGGRGGIEWDRRRQASENEAGDSANYGNN